MKHETEKNAAAFKAAIITSIISLKYDAIRLGFDYPTDPDYDNQPLSALLEFQSEVLEYIMDNWDNYTGPYPTEDQQ